MAIKYENGLHPKHRLIGYHEFFTKNVTKNDRVLDIGSGNGSLAKDVALHAKSVLGVDIDPKNIEKSKRNNSAPNLEYRLADATKDLSSETFDIIIMSNVLEHIDDRVNFLKSIRPLARKFLFRVPMIDREWVTLLKQELGLDYRLDTTHFTEYTFAQFKSEFEEAGYEVRSHSVQFGEIWAIIYPRT
jgi:2-polyprenyl-3-methyl-5-hydroxy-6-metoxy-1,4-benzoquinol methylase